MNGSVSFRKGHIGEKREKALIKFISCQKKFMKKEKEIRQELEEAARIWKETNETLEKRKQEQKGERYDR